MRSLPLLLGQEHPCSYLPGRNARSAFVDPAAPLDSSVYSALATRGFRRSGDLVYRPQCRSCTACLPSRLAVDRFTPDRSQRRIARRNLDLTASPQPARFEEEHYRLFVRYQTTRHGDSGMAAMSRRDYLDFLASTWADTRFVEFRDPAAVLLAVAVVDRLGDGLSAVYTFFDPELNSRSLGTYAVLWQVAQAKHMGLPWVYLGFWIEGSAKMAYKNRFRPLQLLRDGHWTEVEK